MKKLLPLSVIALSTLVYADMSTQEFLYKDPRIMSMGGANTAVGGYSTSIFSNPAGLIKIKKSHGVEVELLGVTVSGSEKIKPFMDDLSNSQDSEIIDTINKYSGDAFNATISNYTSFSYHAQNDIAYSFGLLAAADLNFIPHANSGANGVIETHSRAYGGIFLASAKKYHGISSSVFDGALDGSVTIGVTLKYINQKSYEAGLDLGEVTAHKDDLVQYITDTYEVDNSGVAMDVGALYEFQNKTWNPAIGLSVMNIGTLDFDAYGAQPLSVNLGASVSPEISWSNSLKFSVDYVDVFNSQQARIRNYNPYRSQDQYDNAEIGYDAMNHLRLGASLGLLDNMWFMATLNAGLYKGAYTAGLDMQLAVIKLQLATYQEQLGSEIGQLEDRRYILGLGIGW
ncbi:conjugal transfer protein TraF [Sulfurimonas sp.]|uniref:conjugal transfer protein TraF n=1 Tax=Sulfurimonas sp. TaxID=2022749 RepID=UPI00260464AF|nr:conjugal transfer protein TraF [Sulfurimonas sp.]